MPERRRSYKGVDYLREPGGTSTGVVGDFVVSGTENAFRDAVDTYKGESSLAESGDFTAQLDQAPDDRVGFVYAEPRAIVDALEKLGRADLSGRRSAAGPQLEALLGEPAVAWVSAASDELTLQASAAAGAAPGVAGVAAVAGLPGERLVRLRASPTPARPTGACSTRSGTAPDPAYPQLDGGARLRPRRQISRWAGDVGGFVAGTSLFGLGGALVLETNDEDGLGPDARPAAASAQRASRG